MMSDFNALQFNFGVFNSKFIEIVQLDSGSLHSQLMLKCIFCLIKLNLNYVLTCKLILRKKTRLDQLKILIFNKRFIFLKILTNFIVLRLITPKNKEYAENRRDPVRSAACPAHVELQLQNIHKGLFGWDGLRRLNRCTGMHLVHLGKHSVTVYFVGPQTQYNSPNIFHCY